MIMDKSEDKVRGASGLTDDDLEFYLDSQDRMKVNSPHVVPVREPEASISDDDPIIAKALTSCGQSPDLRHDWQFVVCYNQVAQGPGLHWAPERRVRFTLQTMNRMGALEAEQERRSPVRSVSDILPLRQSQTRPEVSATSDIAVFGYHHLDRHEIIDNLIIVGGIVGITLLAAGATFLCLVLDIPKASAPAGAISLAAVIAAVARFASKWHQRFSFRYRMVRLAVCMALLFSTAAWHVAHGAWHLICLVAKTTIDIPEFGMWMFGVLAALSLLSHLMLCRTYRPDHGRILGWIEALAFTFAIGAFLFCAIHKP